MKASDRLLKQMTSEDESKRLTFYQREDGTFSYDEEKFLNEPEELVWAPAGKIVKFYDSLETAEAEAKANIDWLNS